MIAERIGWSHSSSVLCAKVAELRPLYAPADPADRTVYVAGEIVQCDLWFPGKVIPVDVEMSTKAPGWVGGRPAADLPVLTMVAAFSGFIMALLLPVEIDRPVRPARRDGAKTDDLDAVRSAREALAREHLAAPRARGDRETLRVLLTARQGAVVGRTKAIGQLKAMIVNAPQSLRDQLRRGSTDEQLERCARLRTLPSHSVEHRATVRAIRATARRALFLEAEAAEHETEIEQLVMVICPTLLDRPGVGAITAAQFIVSWSHPKRIRSESAFAALAGAAPIPASSGQTIRHRLNRSGDRQLNRALHTVALSRLQHHAPTKAYSAKRTTEGKSPRDIKRCLKRAIAREIYRHLETHAKAIRKVPQVT